MYLVELLLSTKIFFPGEAERHIQASKVQERLTVYCQYIAPGPLLFTLYTTPLSSMILGNVISHHICADDSQLYVCIRRFCCSTEQFTTVVGLCHGYQ